MTPQATDLHIRWMIRRDSPAVMSIEYQSFAHPWTEDDFLKVMRERQVIGMVIESNEVVVGFMIYRLCQSSLEIVNFAVHPEHRRCGVGFAMFRKIVSKLSKERRHTAFALIADDNLPAQLFFREMEMRCVRITRDWFDNGGDAYRFEYRAKF